MTSAEKDTSIGETLEDVSFFWSRIALQYRSIGHSLKIWNKLHWPHVNSLFQYKYWASDSMGFPIGWR